MRTKNKAVSLIDKLILCSVWLQMILIMIGNDNKILIMFCIFIQFLSIIAKIKKEPLILNKNNKIFLILYLILFAYSIFISVFNKYRNETVITTVLVFASSLLIIFIAWLESEDKAILILLKGFIIIVTFLAIYGIVLRFLGSEPTITVKNGISQSRQFLNIGPFRFSQIVMGNSKNNYGVASLTPNPNSLSYYLLYGFLINQIFIQIKKQKKQKIFLNILLSIIFIFGIFIAGSRLAIILLPFSYILLKVFLIKDTKKRSLLIITTIGIFLFFILFILTNTSILGLIDLNGREEMWSKIPDIVKSNILMGNGIGSSILVLEDLLNTSKASMHNTYFSLISDLGLVISIVMWLAIFLFIIINLRHILKLKNEEYKYIRLILTILMIIILMQAFSESTLLTYSLPNLLFIYSMATCIKRKNY